MPNQHKSRDRIKEILKAGKKPMTPKEVWLAAQLLSWRFSHSAIRKLLREMMRSDVRCLRKGLYCLIEYLSETEINAAPEKEFYDGLGVYIDNHRRQRRTTSAAIIRGLEKALNDERSRSASKRNDSRQ